jgi:hypothetical protein
VSSIAELQAACESGRVAELAGFGKTNAGQALAKAIAERTKHAGSFQLGEHRYRSRERCNQIFAHILTRFMFVLPEAIAGKRNCSRPLTSLSLPRRQLKLRRLSFTIL